eukprot:gene19949-26658_t
MCINFALEDFASEDPVPLPSIFSAPSKTLSVIVPAYNEADRLGATMEEALSYLQKRRNRDGPTFTYEIIIVDDGSRDGTIRVASEIVKAHGFDAVRVLRVQKNRGKGHAVRRGMMIARGESCLFMDADGATRGHAVRRGMMIARGESCLFMDADGATRVSDLEKLEATLARLKE